jgi:syntaxin 5
MNATASSNNNAYAGYAGSSTTTTPSVSTTSDTSRGGQVGGYAGYGGTLSAPPSFATGMRQRKQQNSHPSPYQMQSQQQSTQSISHIQIDYWNEYNDYNEKYNKSSTSMTQQISMRREQRATHMRAQQARLAEKSIAELGVMFHKMSSLIVQQGETLERIEDDVESAGLDIDAGHGELVKVYGMTKGNRGLILKVFGVLIFLIIFMKLY